MKTSNSMKTSERSGVLVLVMSAIAMFMAGALVVPQAVRAAFVWDGGGGDMDWFNGSNWDDTEDVNNDTVPGTTDDVDLWDVGSASSPIIIDNASTADARTLQLANAGQNAPAYLDIYTDLTVHETDSNGAILVGWFDHESRIRQHGGTVNTTDIKIGANRSGADRTYEIYNAGSVLNVSGNVDVGSGETAGFIQSDGDVNIGGTLSVIDSGSDGDTNTYSMQAGTLDVDTLEVGWRHQGLFDHSGGAVTVTGNLEVDTNINVSATGGGEYLIRDAAALDVDGNVILGNTRDEAPAEGRFLVRGSGDGTASIDVDGWTQNATSDVGTGILALEFDEDGIIRIDVDGNVTFKDGSMLDITPPDGYLTGAYNGTYTAMTWTGSVSDNGLGLAPGVDTGNVSYAITGNELQVTLVPEPGTLLLLLVGGVLFGTRRAGAGRPGNG